MCYLSNSMNLSPRVRDYSRNLLCSMYNCNKCTTATVNVRVWHMTVPPAFFASRADTNPCNHRMNCSPLRNLHRHHLEIYLPPRCTDSQKSCGLLDKKGSNFWIIQPWRNQNLAFLSLSPQHHLSPEIGSRLIHSRDFSRHLAIIRFLGPAALSSQSSVFSHHHISVLSGQIVHCVWSWSSDFQGDIRTVPLVCRHGFSSI